MIRVFVVEDQTLVREGLRRLLALLPGIEVVGEAADGEQAVARIPAAGADVVLLDVRMPGCDGLEVLGRLRARGALPPTLILTTFDDEAALFAALRAGARGFLLKDVSLAELGGAIETLAQGGTVIRAALPAHAVAGAARAPKPFPCSVLPDALSPRERDVLRLMGAGFSNREIAEALGMAEGTVKNRASAVFAKLGVRDRTRAVLKAAEMGFL
jgi:DNA-binding NarL/FixJ family response regulator